MKFSSIIFCLGAAFFGASVTLYLNSDKSIESNAKAATGNVRLAQRSGATPRPASEAHLRKPNDPAYQHLTPEERPHVWVYDKCNRSTAHINTTSVKASRYSNVYGVASGEGSGVVLNKMGHILTNAHVVDGAKLIRVTLYNAKSYEAKLVGSDPQTDLAVIKLDAPAAELFPVEVGDSSKLMVGQRVYAIGNPFGLDRTLSSGLVSSLNRTLPDSKRSRPLKSLIQIDADINPGNSGGPLLDSRGRLIGVTTAIASTSGQSAGVGFAIPFSTVLRVATQLMKHGRVIRASIGIGQVYDSEKGLLIVEIIPGGAAEKAGLKGPQIVVERRRQGNYVYERRYRDRTAADFIVAVNGKKVDSAEMLREFIESKKPGDTITLTIIREGKKKQVPLKLQ